MITLCMIINSIGNTVPPVFIFPRARRLHDSFVFGALPGSFVLVNSTQSSWIKGPISLKVLGILGKTYHNYQRRLSHSTYHHKFSFCLLSRIKFHFYSSIFLSTWFHQLWGIPKTVIWGPPILQIELLCLGYLVLQLGPLSNFSTEFQLSTISVLKFWDIPKVDRETRKPFYSDITL
jgi:hypothetical protein